MKTDKSLVPLKAKVSVIATEVHSFEIVKASDMKKATEILSKLNKYSDSVKEKKDLLTKPMLTALKNVRSMFKPIEDTYEGAIEELRSKMSIWQTAETKRAREEEAKIAARVGEGKGHLGIETAIKKIEAIDMPLDNVATEEGDVKFRESKVLKIVDATLIPREYLVPDEKRILNDLKEGKLVAGCEIELVQTVVNYR